MDSYDWVIQITRDALWATLQLSLPVLLVGLVVGLVVSVFQAVTQIQDQTLTFVPKIVAVLLTLLVLLQKLGQQALLGKMLVRTAIAAGTGAISFVRVTGSSIRAARGWLDRRVLRARRLFRITVRKS